MVIRTSIEGSKDFNFLCGIIMTLLDFCGISKGLDWLLGLLQHIHGP